MANTIPFLINGSDISLRRQNNAFILLRYDYISDKTFPIRQKQEKTVTFDKIPFRNSAICRMYGSAHCFRTRTSLEIYIFARFCLILLPCAISFRHSAMSLFNFSFRLLASRIVSLRYVLINGFNFETFVERYETECLPLYARTERHFEFLFQSFIFREKNDNGELSYDRRHNISRV